MTAVLIPTSSEAEWLAARRQGITASEIPVILGLSPWSSPYKLFHQKLGILPADEDNAAMERGRVLEPYVAAKFAEAHPEFSVEGTGRELFAHPERGWQLATPDRAVWQVVFVPDETPELIHEERELTAVLETKTDSGSDGWGEPGSGEIPVHYRAQVLWQMDVMGVDGAFVACLNVPRWEVCEYVIAHDPAGHTPDWTGEQPSGTCDACDDLMIMRSAAELFLDRLKTGDAPDVDWRPATIAALKTLHPSVEDTSAPISTQLAGWYYAACQNAKHWEQRKKLYEARIRKQIGSARRAVDPGRRGQVIARRDVYEVREHVRKASTVDKLVPVYPKENKTS